MIWGLQGGSTPLPKKIWYFASLICIISGPFWANTEIMISGGRKGTDLYLGGCKGVELPACLRKFCILRAKYA